jgi:hypothetical protein
MLDWETFLTALYVMVTTSARHSRPIGGRDPRPLSPGARCLPSP